VKLTYIRWAMTIIEASCADESLALAGEPHPDEGARASSRPFVLVTDPVFRMMGLRQAPKSYTFERMPRPDLVFISHGHFDHLEPATLRRLSADTPVWAPSRLEEKLQRLGLKKVQGVEAWHSEQLRGVRLTTVPARHGGGELGLVVEGERTVYFAGDTSLDAQIFGAISRRWEIDAVLLPIGDLRVLGLPLGHIGPRRAAQALRLLGQPRIVVPTHYSGMTLRPFVAFGGTPRKLSQALEKAELGAMLGTSRPLETVDIG